MGGKQSRTQSYSPSSFDYGSSSSVSLAPYPVNTTYKLLGRYLNIGDNYNSLDEVTEALSQAGLESSNLIVGIDFTKSNEWTGSRSFNRRCLHHLGDTPNPYEQAISIVGRTLSAFDEDDLIPCFGFGDASTHDQEVFSFYPDGRSCNGFEEALTRYREIVPHLKLAGPTSFAPIIETAIGIVENSGGLYHVLIIIADGQVTRSVDTESGHLSPQEQDTINSIVKASDYPLSILLIGVGDGPWDMMKQFDDNIPSRSFDNFQFVNFTEILTLNPPTVKKETEFALAALMEIPSQYKATIDLQLLGRKRGVPGRAAQPPPIRNYSSANSSSNFRRLSTSDQIPGIHNDTSYLPAENPPRENLSANNQQACPVCFWRVKNLAFGCGHQTCYDCGSELHICPICRGHITARIRLY